MSCLLVKLTRDGGVKSATERIGGISTSVQMMPGMTVSLQKMAGMTGTFSRRGGLSCRMYQACRSSIRRPFLEISPEIVWVLAGHTENDVYSNVDWNIH